MALYGRISVLQTPPPAQALPAVPAANNNVQPAQNAAPVAPHQGQPIANANNQAAPVMPNDAGQPTQEAIDMQAQFAKQIADVMKKEAAEQAHAEPSINVSPLKMLSHLTVLCTVIEFNSYSI